MLRDIINKQKGEKDLFLISNYIGRSKDFFGQKWLSSDLIKVVLGPRRAGKSVFSFMMLKRKSFMYFNFDDEVLATLGGISTDELMRELHAIYGDVKTIFFDEIQNLPNWELFVNRLHRLGYNLVLTGSNAQLLSMELATHLTGRHMPIEILPFDFKEFLNANKFKADFSEYLLPEKHGELLKLMDKYLISGGFPEVVVDNLDARDYLDVLLDSLLFKDVIKRHRVKFSTQISNLSVHLINNFASLYTLNKLKKALNLKSVTTIEKYIGYLQESYLLFSLSLFSPKSTERLKSPKKVYVIDNGFITAKAVQHSPDNGKLMENLVFMELIKKGYKPNRELFYYKTRNDREIDFVLKKEAVVTELVQVTYDSTSIEVEEREVKALVEAGHELGVTVLTVITWNEKREVQKDGLNIRFIPLWEWLVQ